MPEMSERSAGKQNKKKSDHAIDMLSGRMWDKIILFALPYLATSVMQQLFNATDTAVVGRFASASAMAAVGANTSVIVLIIGLFTGMAMGTNVVVARMIGEGRASRIHDAVVTSMTIAFISGSILIGAGALVARPLLELMGTPENVMSDAVLYLRLYMLGMPFSMVYNFGSAVLRSKGDSRRPLYCLLASGVFNVALNLLFVIVFGWGVAGVAIATGIASMVSAVIILVLLSREDEQFRFTLRHMFIRKEPLKEIMRIGIPAGIQGMIFSLSNVVLQSAINSFGSDAMAGSAVSQNMEFISYFVINSFTQAAVTFTSQNYGAGDLDRCRKAYKWSMLFGVFAAMMVDLLFIGLRYQFIGLFATDPDVIRYAVMRMMLACLFNWTACSYEITGGALRGMGHSMVPTALTIVGSCLFRIWWVLFLFPQTHTFRSLIMVYPASWFLCGAMVIGAYAIICRRQRRQRQEISES